MASFLIIGAGAVGAFFGSALARNGESVSVVCRSDYEAVKRNGFAIRSPLLGDHTFRPTQVYRSAQEAGTAYDYVVLTTKVLPQTDRVALLRPAIGAASVIVLIQNGIDIEPGVAAAFPDNELLSAIAFIAVARTGGGNIVHHSFGSLNVGCYPRGITPAAQRFAAAFQASGVPCQLIDDVIGGRWQKALWNATFNPISILGGVLDTAAILRTPDDQAFVRKAMQEIAAVAAAAGHPIASELIDKLIAATRGMPPYKSSMALDFEHGRPMEIEAILGNVVRTAQQLRVAVPTLDALYALAKMVEGKLAPR